MSRILKKISVFLLALGIVSAQITPLWAAEQEYTYMVRFFSGAQGTINGDEVVVCGNLHYGDRVTFNQSLVTLKDNSKYYIKGIRESGKDNNTVNNTASFPVTGDMDYVVVYGILGNAVAYTIHYQDANGNPLAPSETFYGNVGDTPVVAFLYIEGYQPQAYNQTRTLTDNAAENVFTFVYTPVDTPTPNPAPGTTPTPTPGTTPAPAPDTTPTAPTVTPAGPDAGDAAGPGEAGEEGGAAPDGGEEGGVAIPDGDVPQELQELNDGDTPLANPDISNVVLPNDFASYLFHLPVAAKAGIFSAAILAGTGGWYLYMRKKRKKTDE